MKSSWILLSSALAVFTFAPTSALATSWDIAADYSSQNNPNGVWSYNRKWTVDGTAADTMTVKWGTSGWYLGNVGNGGPSIQGGPLSQGGVLLWAKYNGNGFPDVRWTAPDSGTFDIVGSFVGADTRGVDNYVYVVVNGTIVFQDRVTGNMTEKDFSLMSVPLLAGSTVDFVLSWAGGVYSEYGWTQANATISEEPTSAPEPTSMLLLSGGALLLGLGRRKASSTAV